MEKVCEFCVALRPVIYCKADAAHLCLSCDAKIHSANALSSRHLRTLLCDSCRSSPTYVECLDHQLFLCRVCDRSLHDLSSKHQKRAISSYTGCPSAKDFAALWGFQLSQMNNFVQDQFVSTSSCSSNSTVTNLDVPEQSCSRTGGHSLVPRTHCTTRVTVAEPGVGSCCHLTKISYKHQETSAFIILQQILDLKKLQLTEGNNRTLLIRGEEDTSSLEKLYETLDQHSQHTQDLSNSLRQRNNSLEELNVASLAFPFSQLEYLSFSSAAVNGESLWLCKSPTRSSQLWSQNMQDLGVCAEVICDDDFNMPDVDLTFRNFEEQFGGDQDPMRGLLDDKDESHSSAEKDMSLVKSDNHFPRRIEDLSLTSSAQAFHSAPMDKDIHPSFQDHNILGILKSPCQTRPSRSTLSFSKSKFGVDSSSSDCLDNGFSSHRAEGKPSCSSHDIERTHLRVREDAMMRRYNEKKSRLHEKQTECSSRKDRDGLHKRSKGRSPTVEAYDSDTILKSERFWV